MESITEQYANGRDLLVIDPSDWCVAAQTTIRPCRERHRTKGRSSDALSDSNQSSTGLMINVLEHIEDDVAALRTLRRLLRPGGRIVLYVPALNGLYGAYDRKVGHFRRYAPWRMREIVNGKRAPRAHRRPLRQRAGHPGLAGVFTYRRRGEPVQQAGALGVEFGVPMTRLVESRVAVTFGLNLFCVAGEMGPAR